MNFRTRILALAVVGALVASMSVATGCGKKDSIATVDGRAIPQSEVDKQLAQIDKQSNGEAFKGKEGAKRKADLKAKILERLIQIELMHNAADKLGVDVSEKQIEEYIARLEKQYGGRKGLEQALKASGITIDQLKKSIRDQLLAEAVSKKLAKNLNVTDAQIKEYYEANLAQFKATKLVDAVHILVAAKDKTLAESILAQVKAGGDIAALAKKYSTDPGSKDKGGALGWKSTDTYVANFKTALDTMKIGEVRLVQTEYGWHVVKLLGQKAGYQKPLSEVSAQIKSILESRAQYEALNKYLEGLRKKAEIDVPDAALKTAVEQAQKTTAGQ